MKNYFNSITKVVKRSEIHLSDYNPRKITEEGKKALKKSIKTYGIVGGIIVNSQTNNTIVGGHQKVSILDEIYKYNSKTKENDYEIKAEFIDVDERIEKQLNIVLNNPNVGGEWDFDALASLVPEIDWKDAGLTENDLNLICVDYLLKTEEESSLAQGLDELMGQVKEKKALEKEMKAEKSEAEKIAHMKEVKKQVQENAQKVAEDMDAYVMLSFDTYAHKVEFMNRFGYPGDMRIIKGEVFDNQIERVE